MTVKSTVEQILKEYPTQTFPISGTYLTVAVRSRMAIYNKRPMDGTIMRKLRELRNAGYIIDCINRHKSLYRIEGKNV